MLTHLGIKNFTTVDHLDLEFEAGLTTITGETGAGKSVMLDALAMALGTRSQKNMLRKEQSSAEITASFQLQPNSPLIEWLQARELLDDNQPEVICRRVIKNDGRSRAFINGCTVNLGDLQKLGEQLVDLHSQHEHQSLLNKATHAQLLDDYAGNQTLLAEVCTQATAWSQKEQKIQQLRNSRTDNDARAQLLSYQVQELDSLSLEPGETEQLEADHKILANAGSVLQEINAAIQLCGGEESSAALTTTRQAIMHLQQCIDELPALNNCIELLDSASIQIEEAHSEINRITEKIYIDPERLQQVENRLDVIYSIARKHHINPAQLAEQHKLLDTELRELEQGDEIINQLIEEQKGIESEFHRLAKKLSKRRKKAASSLTIAVSKKLAELQMKHCHFQIDMAPHTDKNPNNNGHEAIEFLISTVPGKPAQALNKIASGGELSRISLAIQVVTAQTSDTPTLVFDEVDVGIGGGVAEVVGNLLRELGQACQVFCVTHLAQVAAKGSQHLLVSKKVSQSAVTTSIAALGRESRQAELARMISGLDVTASTMAHAAEMLESA